MIVSDNVDFAFRFKDKRCDDNTIERGFNDTCRHVCESNVECKYYSQWLYQEDSGPLWCETYKSCATQSPDPNGVCVPDGANPKVCPIKTFEKIGTFLNNLVNVVLLF